MKLSYLTSIVQLSLCVSLLSCKSQSSQKSEILAADAMQQVEPEKVQLQALEDQTPREISPEALASRYGYNGFPSEIFARKGGVLTEEDRIREKSPPKNNDSAAHRFLMDLGQQIYQQALLGYLRRDEVYLDNSKVLLEALVKSQVRYINDPKNPTETNDNRMLESAWFLSLVARGARILDLKASVQWKQKNQWDSLKSKLNDFIGWNFDQTRYVVSPTNTAAQVAEAYKKASFLDLASGPGLMNWVASTDSVSGSTNRTFAALEAQFRVAEFRGGKIGYAKWHATSWSLKDKLARESEGQFSDLFLNFRYYLRQYFTTPTGQNTGTLIIKSDPKRTTKPGELNRDDCKDPAQTGYKASCLVNKDAYRNDNYHPQMGLASVMNILNIAKRNGFDLTLEEQTMLKEGLRWACYFNHPDVVSPGAKGSFGIHTWELAFRFYGSQELGPYCQTILEKNRSRVDLQKASFGWGFDLINENL